MKKKNGIIIVAIICCVAAAFTWYVIGKSSKVNKTMSDSGIDFWVAPATEKVMQDVAKNDYADIKLGDKISVSAVKNEYENAQLIMTATKDITTYNAEVSDLVEKESGAVISNKNVTVYSQLYVEVLKRVNTYYDYPSGMYPDGLVPMENMVQYGNTQIKKGENQGLWLTFYVPKDAEVGEYRGSITVNYGKGQTHTTEISLTVYDYTLSDETKLRTAFSIEWPYDNGELDSSYEMFKNYSDTLLQYRISSDLYRGLDAYSESGFEELIRYANEPLRPVIYLPYKSASYDGVTSFDYALMKEMILKFANRSIEDNKNYIPQLMVYFGTLIDEPNPENEEKEIQVKYICNAWNKLIDETANELKRNTTFMENGTLAEEIVNEIRNIEHIVVGYKHGDHATAFGEVMATWCPTNDYFMDGREYYDKQNEKWWYTMLVPYAPYSTYHIDDVLLSSRMLSWMQYDYDVTGNLYWAVNNYISTTDTAIEDYYGLMSSAQTPGDGYLCYPGAKYGVDGPLPSIRLMSIRDGIEEYDMLCDLGQQYSELKSVVSDVSDFKTILNNYTQYLYDGTKSMATTGVFNVVRETLLNMLEMSTKKCFLVNYEQKDDSMLYAIFAKEGAHVNSDAESVQQTATYTIGEISYGYYEAEGNGKNVCVAVEGKEYDVSMKFVGTSQSVTNEKMTEENFAFVNGGLAERTTYDGKSVFELSVPKMANDKTQIIHFSNDELFGLLDDSANTLTLQVYVEESVTVKLNFKYQNKNSLYEIATVTLNPGLNNIEVKNLFSYDWENLGDVEYAALYVGNKGDDARTIYFGDIYLTTLQMGEEKSNE